MQASAAAAAAGGGGGGECGCDCGRARRRHLTMIVVRRSRVARYCAVMPPGHVLMTTVTEIAGSHKHATDQRR